MLRSIRSEKLKATKRSQDRQFILNIRGVRFESCGDTMGSEPNSLLSQLLQTVSPLKPYYPKLSQSYSDILPRGVRHLRELQAECHFNKFKHLSLNCERRIMDLKF